MEDFNQTCFGCFRQKGGARVCPHCGYADGAPQHSPMCLPAGTILGGRYILGKTLGQGGFGITYLGCDLATQEKVAVKEYLPDGMATRTAANTRVSVYSRENDGTFVSGMQKFLDEAKILARFTGNPYIVNVRAFFKENGTAYYVMDYVEGQTLKEYIKNRGGRLPYPETLRLLAPILGALESVHAVQLLHRDISPDNIYVTASGQARLLDFGAARYNVGGEKSLSVILKPGFAPEEQYRSHGRQGPWTDIYALGATFYYALTGTVPVSSLDRLQRDELVPFPRLGVTLPAGIEPVLMKALAPRAEARWQSVGEFRGALNNPQDLSARQRLQGGEITRSARAAVIPAPLVKRSGLSAVPPPSDGRVTWKPGAAPHAPPGGPQRPPIASPSPGRRNNTGLLLAIFIPVGVAAFFLLMSFLAYVFD